MSTITDAIKKRRKEAGGKDADDFVPVDLDEPDVDVPKARGFGRIVILAAVLLLVVAAAVIGGVILYRGRPGERSAGKKPDEPTRTASLPQPDRQDVLPAGETEKAPPPKPVETVKPAPETPSSPTTAAETPSGPPAKPRPEIAPTPQPVPEGPIPSVKESPPEVAPTAPPEGPESAGKEREEVPLPLPAPETDPFAAIKLQGIIRFDPTAPEVLINGKVLKVGDSLNGIEIIEIAGESVKLRYKNIEKTIRY